MNDSHNNKNENQEIDLSKLARQLWSSKWYILKCASITALLGIIIAFSIPKEYTCKVKMVPEETKSSITGNISSLAAMAGINIGANKVDGINLTLYPDVVHSISFISELINIQVPDKGIAPQNTLYNYIDKELRQPWWNSIIASPFRLISIFSNRRDKGNSKMINPYKLTREQERNFAELSNRISVFIDKKTGIITVGVSMQDALISAIVADSLVSKLERFVIDYRTNKAKQDFNFASNAFVVAKKNYYDAQKNYAHYTDANKNIVLESVLIEQERLKNEQLLAYNVYSTLAQQLEAAKLKVQEQTPCVTIIEPARIPSHKSNTSRLLIAIIFCILGATGSIIKIIYSEWNKILL